jgi:hypothetical protein
MSYADTYDGYTAWLGNIMAEPEHLLAMAALKKGCEVLAKILLVRFNMVITPLNHDMVFNLEVIP